MSLFLFLSPKSMHALINIIMMIFSKGCLCDSLPHPSTPLESLFPRRRLSLILPLIRPLRPFVPSHPSPRNITP